MKIRKVLLESGNERIGWRISGSKESNQRLSVSEMENAFSMWDDVESFMDLAIYREVNGSIFHIRFRGKKTNVNHQVRNIIKSIGRFICNAGHGGCNFLSRRPFETQRIPESFGGRFGVFRPQVNNLPFISVGAQRLRTFQCC